VPLKRTISKQISQFLRSDMRRIQKVEWVERFMIAKEQAIMKKNILARWSGTGLFPENMDHILKHLID